MKDTFTKTMAWLHTWVGLWFGWVLFAIFFTGTLSVFATEISHWMQPELPSTYRTVTPADLKAIEAMLAEEGAGAEEWNVKLPDKRMPFAGAWWAMGHDFQSRVLDVVSGRHVTPRSTIGGYFFVHFHYALNWRPAGAFIVAALSVGLLVLLISGVVIHKRIFKDFFTFRPRARTHRAWLDAHNVTGVLALPFHIMITYTGIIIFHATYVPAGVNLLYGGDAQAYERDQAAVFQRPAAQAPAPSLPLWTFLQRGEDAWGAGQVAFLRVMHPGDRQASVLMRRAETDRLSAAAEWLAFDAVGGEMLASSPPLPPAGATHQVMSGLHFARFGGSAVRWLYFVLGLMGSAMIATGLIVFTAKRQQRNGTETRSLWLAERLNVAAIVGPIAASAAYLWGSRLIPAAAEGRIAMEWAVFFAALLFSVVHALWRKPAAAWREQFAAAAVLCLGVPVVNVATADTGLAIALANGDWMRAGVDLTALAFGLIAAAIAFHLTKAGLRGPARAEAGQAP